MKSLDDEQTEGIAGGYLFDSNVLADWYATMPWEVLDEKGDVVARFGRKDRAEEYAAEHGFSIEELNWDQVQKLRETSDPYC